MRWRRRTSERVEPVMDVGDGGRDSLLDFGLKDSDRSVPTRRKSKADAAGRGRNKGSPQRGPVRRALRRTAHWIAVILIITVGSLGAVTAYYASKLPPPSQWTVPKRAANVRILAANGQLISNRADSSGQSLTLDQMPPFLPEAVMAIEDRRFYWHFGIDPIGLARAFVADVRAGHIVEGGSTITQQLAKNLFLTPERTFGRKIQELLLALWLECNFKTADPGLYLNRVSLGAGAYGVDAAAHSYFGNSARNITLAEAATLAGMLKAPSTYSPSNHPQAAEAREQTVLTAMADAGFITARQATLAMSTQVKAVHDVAGGSGRYVADWVMDILPNYIGVYDQDIVVDTTIDLNLQTAAAKAISDTLASDGTKYRVGQGALVAIDPDGAVKALVGGRDYASSPFNRAVDAHRQPGSAFKPFVYLTALEGGLVPETVRIDQPVSVDGWQPEDYTKSYRGPVTLTTALALSLNSVSAELTAEVGPAAVAATAHRLGIISPLMATPSIALGTSEVTPLELTAAYVPFSNGGRGVIPHVIRRITTTKGKVLYERTGSGPGQVIAPMYVGMMNAMLEQTLLIGTAKAAQIPGWPAAGKTGTSQDYRDAWFVGYTADLTAGVWFGNDDNSPTKRASGGNLPAIAWQHFMSDAVAGLAVADLPGNYQLYDPGNPLPPRSVADMGNGQPYAVAPDAPGYAPPRPLGGFFQAALRRIAFLQPSAASFRSLCRYPRSSV